MKHVIVLNSTYAKMVKAASFDFDCNPRKFSENCTSIEMPDKLYSAINVFVKLTELDVDEVIVMLIKKMDKDNAAGN